MSRTGSTSTTLKLLPAFPTVNLLDAGGWTEPLLRRWARMLADDAQEVIRYMAAHAPEVSVADIALHLGLSKGLGGPCGKHVLGGVMCSAGANRKKLRVAKLPFEFDARRRRYLIDPQIAGILADELGDGEGARS
jgi:hypothetical protein